VPVEIGSAPKARTPMTIGRRAGMRLNRKPSGQALTSRPAFSDVGVALMLAFLCNACFGGEMRAVSYLAVVTGLVLLGSLAASNHGTAGSYSDAASDHGTAASYSDQACSMPVQLSCRGCAVTCLASKPAICRAGINIWRGNAWACLFQPTCSCQKSIWSLLPEQVRQSRKFTAIRRVRLPAPTRD
jgi:hypothetical protein